MSSLMAIKPNRRELIKLLAHTIKKRNLEKATALLKEVEAIKAPYLNDLKEFTDHAVAKAIGGEMEELFKHAEQLGFEKQIDGGYRDGTVSITLFKHGIKPDMRKQPKLSEKTQKKIDELSVLAEQLRRTYIDEESILHVLMEANQETKAELDAMADIISKNMMEESTKLIAGEVDA